MNNKINNEEGYIHLYPNTLVWFGLLELIYSRNMGGRKKKIKRFDKKIPTLVKGNEKGSSGGGDKCGCEGVRVEQSKHI